jgi:hypothetical protein
MKGSTNEPQPATPASQSGTGNVATASSADARHHHHPQQLLTEGPWRWHEPTFTRRRGSAYIATAEAVVRLVQHRGALKRTEWQQLVGHAYAALIMSLAGDANHAARRAHIARRSRSSITRRERQLVEILLLSVDGTG